MRFPIAIKSSHLTIILMYLSTSSRDPREYLHLEMYVNLVHVPGRNLYRAAVDESQLKSTESIVKSVQIWM